MPSYSTHSALADRFKEMQRLILVKHSLPEIRPEIPPAEWVLGAEGRRRCIPLAAALARYAPDGVISSQESKAAETARLIAQALNLPVHLFPNLQEHHRRASDFGTPEAFQEKVTRFFAEPEQLVFGEETAAQAEARFTAGLEAALQAFPNRRPVIAAHGTVISLYVSRITGWEPLDLWKSLGLPSIVVLEGSRAKVVNLPWE
jgi:broad specificity phosphatase PhoE